MVLRHIFHYSPRVLKAAGIVMRSKELSSNGVSIILDGQSCQTRNYVFPATDNVVAFLGTASLEDKLPDVAGSND